MPVAPEFRKYYGWTWRTRVRPVILARCGGVCERCRRCPRRLEVAHLDGVPGHDDETNLAALCSACHHRVDRERWRRASHETRAARKDRARPLLEVA